MADRKTTPISDGIRAAIRGSGRPVYSIAGAVGCSPQQLYNFLSGKRGLSLEILDGLAVVLDLEVTHCERPTEDDDHAQAQGPSPDAVTVAGSGPDPGEEPNRRHPPEAPHQSIMIPPHEPAASTEITLPATMRDSCSDDPPPVKDLTTTTSFPLAASQPNQPQARPGLSGLAARSGLGGRRSPFRPTPTGQPLDPNDPIARAFGTGSKTGVIPWDLSAAPGTTPIRDYRPDSAADPEPEHFNTAQGDIKKMLGLWGSKVEAFYKSQGRDTPAKKNIYNFLSVLSRNEGTSKHLSYMKKFPMANVLNWVQAFPPQRQMEIASRLPFLDDGLNEEDPSVTKRFWDRVDKDSFYKAVEKIGLKPDSTLSGKYVERKARASSSSPSDGPEEPSEG